MSSKARKERKSSVKEVNIRRLVHDVMMYTLPTCGLPETRLTPTTEKENVYKRENFLEIACVCTLRVSLAMRDRLKRMFQSRLNGSGFKKEHVPLFLEKIAVCCPLSYANTTQSIVNVTFALCNEIILFFHHEDVDIDFSLVMDATSSYVTRVIRMNPLVPENIEGLFDNFENVSWYRGWLIHFIGNFAIPYGSVEDVSEIFLAHVKNEWKALKEGQFSGEKLPMKVMRGYLGYLPDHLFEVIALEDAEELTEDLSLEAGSMPSCDHESREPTELSASSESGAVGGSESSERRSSESAIASEQAAQDERYSESSSELAAEELGRLSLGAEGSSQEQKQVKKKKKKTGKKKRC